MKIIYLFIAFFVCSIFYAQERLSFLKNNEFKEEVKKSIEYLNKTKVIPTEIKNKVVFITFDFDNIFDESQAESIGISYSTHLPNKYSVLNIKGEFTTSSQNDILYYNYSKNIVFIFFKGFKYLDKEQMKELSKEIQISKENLMKSEFFKYEKGNKVTLDAVENFISLERKDGKFTPVRINTFDLKTFMEVWYGLDVKEIPVSQTKYKGNK